MSKKHAIISITVLTAAVCALLALWLLAKSDADAERLAAQSARSGALLSAIAEMEKLQTTLSKAQVTPGQGADELLSDIRASAASVQAGLSAIPAADDALERALKFVNQLGDYAAAQTRVGGAGDAETLGELSAACQSLAQVLSDAHARVLAGGDGAVSAVDDAVKAVEYPALLYDGPFSDARETGAPRGLPDFEVAADQALAIAKAFVGERATNAVRAADSGGAIPAYGVTVETSEGQLQIAVTRQGGKVLWMSPETVDAQAAHSEADCERAAAEFLAARGFENMRATWRQAYDGLLVASFAAEQDGVLLYPDQMKVQVRMDTLAVVGLEAHSYWMNHAPREALTPAIPQEEAQGAVSENIEISRARLCVIPVTAGERLCYEFYGTSEAGKYLSYIDAQTGAQIELLKVVQTDAGELTV